MVIQVATSAQEIESMVAVLRLRALYGEAQV